MAQSRFADPELTVTNFSVSSVCNNLSKEGDVLVRYMETRNGRVHGLIAAAVWRVRRCMLI